MSWGLVILFQDDSLTQTAPWALEIDWEPSGGFEPGTLVAFQVGLFTGGLDFLEVCRLCSKYECPNVPRDQGRNAWHFEVLALKVTQRLSYHAL